MKKKKKVKKVDEQKIIITFGIIIFMIGIIFGSQTKIGNLSKIQGYLYHVFASESATDSNATDSNATDSNATDSNATDSNATDANATDSNLYDGIIYLESIEFEYDIFEADEEDYLYLYIYTYGAPIVDGTIELVDDNNHISYILDIYFMDDWGSAMIMPAGMVDGTYEISNLYLVGRNSDGSKFTKNYSRDYNKFNSVYYDFDSIIKVDNPQIIPKATIDRLSIDKDSALPNEKIAFDMEYSGTNDKFDVIKLNFNSVLLSESFTTYVESVNDELYFTIPSTVKPGSYMLSSITVQNESYVIVFNTTNKNINSSLLKSTIIKVGADEASSNSNYYYNNNDIDEKIITNIYNYYDSSVIYINANDDPFIIPELFNAIKGSSKKLIVNYNNHQIIFDGNITSEIKTINSKIDISTVNSTSDVSKLINGGIVVDFASNGVLPSEAVIRIFATEDIKKEFGSNSINIYYFNEELNKFLLIKEKVVLSDDGYYEFNIDHMSKYVLVKDKIQEKLLTDVDDSSSTKVVAFQKSDKLYIVLISVGILTIIGATVGIMLVKNKQKKENNI